MNPAAARTAEAPSESLAELRARAAEVEREWHWLHRALNSVARARAEKGETVAFALMQRQAMAVGQRRVELSVRIAEMEGPGAGPGRSA